MTTEPNPSVPDYGTRWTNYRRKAIPATCQLHRGPVGYANLMVNERNGSIVFDPHVTGSCVISLDQEGAAALRDLLITWLQ
ncbi:MAG: hypothetical protein JO281_01720 [Pseudonocardiales bacterium]|nr:hypothetical protein [Pseudonocardiales bacterium]